MGSDAPRQNPFTDRDVTYMLHDLDALVRALHPDDPLYSKVTHNHHACIRLREWIAQLEASPPVEPESAMSSIVSDVADAVEVWDGLTAAQQAALIVLADGKEHYCWKWATNVEGQGGRGCVNAKATSRLLTLHLARTVQWGGAFTGDTVEITDAGQAVFDGSVFA